MDADTDRKFAREIFDRYVSSACSDKDFDQIYNAMSIYHSRKLLAEINKKRSAAEYKSTYGGSGAVFGTFLSVVILFVFNPAKWIVPYFYPDLGRAVLTGGFAIILLVLICALIGTLIGRYVGLRHQRVAKYKLP